MVDRARKEVIAVSSAKNRERMSELEEQVRAFHEDSFIFDALATSYPDAEAVEALKAIGLDAVHYTVASISYIEGRIVQDSFIAACRKIGRWYSIFDRLHEEVELATSVESMERINKDGKLAIFMGFQNGSPMEDNKDYARIFKQLGVRIIQLTYNSRNMIGDGSGETADAGLSKFGFEMVEEMNRLGLLIDLSHCHHKTTMDAIGASESPVVFTHANARALADTPRNKSDEEVTALARRGGVIGIKHMLGDTEAKKAEATTVADVVDHIDHVVDLVGVDHVCIGTDFAVGSKVDVQQSDELIDAMRQHFPQAYRGKRVKPQGLSRIGELFNLTRELMRRGYRDEELKKIYGLNFRRVLEHVIG